MIWLQYCYWSWNICQFLFLFLSCTWTCSHIRGFLFAGYNCNDTLTSWGATFCLCSSCLVALFCKLARHSWSHLEKVSTWWEMPNTLVSNFAWTSTEGKRHVHISMHACIWITAWIFKETTLNTFYLRLVCYSFASALNL